ncbi:MAG: helix-turn-helix transcriptional regulator [Clostridiales bacterium]|nr:helix-turn-helix transcriptional regulator [Clostridiales bacterium]
MNEFKERLEELLIDKKISRLFLAKEIGVSSTTINGYFNKGYYPRIDIAIKIADYFGCSLDYLFGFDDKINGSEKSEKPFIENLNFLIKEKKISVAKALFDMKMSEYDYYRWKKGLFPKTVNLLIIAKYFNVGIDFLIGKM